MDLRDDPRTKEALGQKGQKPVMTEEGQKLATDLHAYKYLECSALTQVGLKQVFDEAIRCVIAYSKKPAKKKSTCSIL